VVGTSSDFRRRNIRNSFNFVKPKTRFVKKIIEISTKSSQPKYKQIINSVFDSIERKSLVKGDKIPSINSICKTHNLSRDTVMTAFNELKAQGIVASQPGKGYFVATTEVRRKENIFILFDELNSFKEDLFNSLINTLKGKANVDLFFHNFNLKVFRNLILQNVGKYTAYIIMPGAFNNISHIISKLPQERVFIIDRMKPELNGYSAVFQDFENDFYDALNDGLKQLKKYRKLVFVDPGGKEPLERADGFERFCNENKFNYKVVKTLDGIRPELYEAYFLIADRDLVKLIKVAKSYKYKLGKKFGIVSFNDSILKEVIAGGITTISTDFAEMGKTLGNMVLTRKTGRYRNPCRLIVRKSL